jgi:anti-sigma B factor antagonist
VEAQMDDSPFGIRSSWEAETVVFEVTGEIDMATAPEVATAVDGVREAARRVVVDLTGATFLDSAAINTLLRCRRELGQLGVTFKMVSPPNGVVRKALDITNVIAELGVVDSRAEAMS